MKKTSAFLFSLLVTSASVVDASGVCNISGACYDGGGNGDDTPSACAGINNAINTFRTICTNPQNAAQTLLALIAGVNPKCTTATDSSSSGAFTVSATATVCTTQTPTGPNQVFSCSATANGAAVNTHVDCGPTRIATDTRDPVPTYGAGATTASTGGLMLNRTQLKVRYSGITSGNSLQREFTMPIP